ncbi:MAG: hypothetical protein IT289_13325 [Oligoflexia bacterium]|nr:hypothetical protein [Oligoflexia bacterium]
MAKKPITKKFKSERFELIASSDSSIDELLSLNAFDYKSAMKVFPLAMDEAFEFHFKNNPVFKKLCKNFRSRPIRTYRDVEDLPWVFVQNLKLFNLHTIKDSEVCITLTSSGTQGTKTENRMDKITLNRVEVGAYNVYRDLGIVDGNSKPSNYLMFTYDIDEAPYLGTTWTDELIAQMTPQGQKAFLIKKGNRADFEFRLDEAVEHYAAMAKSHLPIRFLGFPAFMFALFKEIERRKLPPILAHQDSWILTGGGWKNHEDEDIGKTAFAEYAHRVTGIRPSQVRDLFGMSEHGVGYVDCEMGRLHIPIYAHAITRDPYTLKALPDGKPGCLQLFTPLLRSIPSLSLLTTDEAVVESQSCECGRPGPGLRYIGRMGLKKHEGCAIKALSYLRSIEARP